MAESGMIQFNTETARGGSLGAQATVPNAGITGGEVRSAPSPAPAFSWFDSAGGMDSGVDNSLPEFINDVVAPSLEATKTKRMWEGFVAAREGQQLDEIAKDQPWYSRLFGPTNFEVGAMTYEAQKRSADLENRVMEEMPVLRTKSAQEMAGVLNDMARSQMTGNGYADAILQKTFMERASTIMDLHTKERVAWQNTEQLRMQFEAGTSASTALQRASARAAEFGGKDGPESRAAADALVAAKIAYLDVMSMSDYQTDESKWAAIRARYMDDARNGRMYSISALDEIGLRGALSVERQAELQNVVDQGRNYYMANLPVDHPLIQDQTELAVNAQRGYASAEDALADVGRINSRYMALTGDTRGPYTAENAQRFAASALNATYEAAEQERRARESAMAAASTDEAKRAVDQQKIEFTATTFRTGSLEQLVANKAIERADAEQAVMSALSTNPQDALKAAVQQFAFPLTPFVSEKLKAALRQSVDVAPDSDWTPRFHQAYEMFKVMRDTPVTDKAGNKSLTMGRSAAREYFGAANVELFDNYEKNMATGVQADVAYAQARRRASTLSIGRGDLSEASFKKLEGAVAGPGWITRMFTGEKRIAQQGVLTAYAVRERAELEKLYPDLPEDEINEMAVQSARSKNVDVAGEYSWPRMPGQKAISDPSYKVDSNVYGAALAEYMRRSLKKANVELDSDPNKWVLTVVRHDDRNGYPYMSVSALDRNGHVANLHFGKAEFDLASRLAFEKSRQTIAAPQKQQAVRVIPGLGF